MPSPDRALRGFGLVFLVAAAFTNPSQLNFTQNGTGAVKRTIASKLGDVVSVCDFESPCPNATDDGAAFTSALTAVGNGTLLIPAGTYHFAATLSVTPANNGWLRLLGTSMDGSGTVLQFTNAGDGLQLNGESTAEDLNIQTTNAGAGIGLRLSGLSQIVKNVQVTRSGSGVWAKCIQALGTVTTKLDTIYTNSNACTIGLDVVPNGSNAVGNLNIVNAELRAASNCMHIGGATGALSIAIFGGAIESCGGTGILADGAGGHSLSIYGTHFEQNTTDDIKWTTGGDLSIFEANFVTGATNAINCPNTTCTARLRVYGAIGNATNGAVIIGDSIGISSVFGSRFRGSAFTVGKSSNLMRWGNTSFDATTIQNFVADDGSGNAKISMLGTGNTTTMQSASGGTFQFFHNGVEAFDVDGSGFLKPITRFILNSVTQANLGTPANGTLYYCSDCLTGSNPCTGASTGSLAVRQNSAWKCF